MKTKIDPTHIQRDMEILGKQVFDEFGDWADGLTNDERQRIAAGVITRLRQMAEYLENLSTHQT
jgi:hypothetical protein